MSKRALLFLSGIVAALIIGITLLSTEKKAIGSTPVNPAFSGYISAYTSGIISNESPIRILLVSETGKPVEDGQIVEDQLFHFSPEIKGTTVWVNSRTLEFRPEHRMPSGQLYTAEFHINKLMQVSSSDLEVFEFSFKTIPQSFEVVTGVSVTTDKQTLRWQQLKGTLSMADGAETDAIEKILSAQQNNKSLNIKWNHIDKTTHEFVIDSVNRSEEKGKFTVSWNGKPVDADIKGSKEIEVPALGDFKVTNVEVMQAPDQYVSVQFSDPIAEKQDLDGLISFDDNSSLKFIIEDNEVKAYPAVRQSGERTINVRIGVKNILGMPLPLPYTTTVKFEELKPQVKLLGKGVILPNSNGLIFPFEAVSLSAVDVKITKIFENNIPQFLQVNTLEGDRELKRVGKVVLKKKIDLTVKSALDHSRWNTYSLDLADLIKTEPGAIYKVVISFKKEYSTYHCDESEEGSENNSLTETTAEEDEDEDSEDYNDNGYYSDYYYDDYYEGDYESEYNERDNPCNSAYYRRSHDVSRNVLASDLGLIAKYGSGGLLNLFVSDLISTKPLQNITLELYDYQQQLLSTVKSDGQGMASVQLKKKPFLLVAKNGSQRGYLKIDDGSSLSLSMFDVSGEYIQKGIKGFLYGERGVWRPGDTLFLSFILEDKQNTLPKNHPVSFELINPRGQISKRTIKSEGLDGFYNFTTTTDKDAPTGNWTAQVKVGGATFTKTLKIETIMPNRLKIKLDFGTDKIFASKQIEGKLNVKWLHGAIAKGLQTKVDVTLSSGSTSFAKYEEYNFNDPAARFQTESQTIFDDHISEEGTATITPDIALNGNAPGMLTANFVVRAFEEGGAFSIDRFTMPYYPYSSYIGIKSPEGNKYSGALNTDTNHILKIVTLDTDGKPVSRTGLKVKVYKIGWRWWWESRENDLANYVSEEYYQPIQNKEINTVNGKGEFVLRVNRPDWGRYMVRITDEVSGHSSGQVVYLDWPWWAGSSPKGKETATLLSFTTEKEKYKVGENVTINIPSGSGGRALVSIESGSKVLKAYWVETQKDKTSFSFVATPDMAPNVYINVTLIQPHGQTKNDLPIRLYGIMPIQVEDPNTHNQPVITTADVWRPEEKASITISEKDGKDMTYTLAVVDEGLLDLTRFATPSPWDYFYAREALGVKTWDLYDMVMGAYGAALERILAIGGDGEGAGKGAQKANRFKPMVKFIGPFHIKKGEKKTHEFMMPQYVGSVRVMAISGYDLAYGNAEKTVAVRKPLMLLATLPRVVGPGETVDLPVDIFAMEKKVKNVTIEIQPNKFFTLEDGNKRSISFKEIGDEVVTFKLKVRSELGIGKVKIIATGAGEKAVQEIEIDVRNPNPRITEVKEMLVDAGQKWSGNYTPVGMAGTNKVTLEVSTIPPVNLSKRLEYLIQYPHGCIEQTTSSVFPQVYLSDVIELKENEKKAIEKNIIAGIQRLKLFQVSSGGFSYWPGNLDADDWGSNYAGHFLAEASAKGYTVPESLFNNWKKYQKQRALSWTQPGSGKNYSDHGMYFNDDLIQAYRLYTLALAQAPEMGAMNRMKELKTISLAAKWRLAAAYSLAGQTETANKLITSLPTKVESYRELAYSYGSSERDEAMILETLTLLGDKPKAAGILKKVSEELSRDEWMSTQTTAYCLIAVAKFVNKNKMGGGIDFTYKVNGTEAVNATTQLAISKISLNAASLKSTAIEIKNNSKGLMYARIVLEGIPVTGDDTESENNLNMTIDYTDMTGNTIDPSSLEQGTDFIAEVSITNPGLRGDYQQMALTQIFPSGWEIHNSRMDEGPQAVKSSIPTYQDIRDDRVYTYFDINHNQKKTFRILLNASYTGKFYLPSVSCEAMYDITISSHKAGQWIEVVKPGGKS